MMSPVPQRFKSHKVNDKSEYCYWKTLIVNHHNKKATGYCLHFIS
jgi:hypothetical protein